MALEIVRGRACRSARRRVRCSRIGRACRRVLRLKPAGWNRPPDWNLARGTPARARYAPRSPIPPPGPQARAGRRCLLALFFARAVRREATVLGDHRLPNLPQKAGRHLALPRADAAADGDDVVCGSSFPAGSWQAARQPDSAAPVLGHPFYDANDRAPGAAAPCPPRQSPDPNAFFATVPQRHSAGAGAPTPRLPTRTTCSTRSCRGPWCSWPSSPARRRACPGSSCRSVARRYRQRAAALSTRGR